MKVIFFLLEGLSMEWIKQLQLISKIFFRINQYISKATKFSNTGNKLNKTERNQHMQKCSSDLLGMLNVQTNCIKEPQISQPSIFVGNHISYLDILVLVKSYPLIFVAKEEVGNWPFIGKATKLTNTILLKREDKKSRNLVRRKIANKILEQEDSLAIFPSGTTSIEKKNNWRKGAFEIAQENNIPIVPFRISYSPLRQAAFIDNDYFLPHLLSLTQNDTIQAYIEFEKPRKINNIKNQIEELENWSQDYFI
ncbi:MAG: hypothetical protein CMP11_03840 [Zetaproteobacteria bacterium]|nr:hypothetical protein [Pseudobdellovibrionaceae bacterium]